MYKRQDLSSLSSVREEFGKAAEKYGCIDILVNNAGVSESTPFTEYTEETFDKVMDLNVKGVFNACLLYTSLLFLIPAIRHSIHFRLYL